MVKRAITFGINYTGTDSELKGCWNDSKKIKQMLIKSCGYLDKNIEIITDETTSVLKPTRDVILNKLRTLISLTKENDTLFFHYSGHGTYTADKNGDEIDGKDELLYPCDGKVICDDELYEILIKPLVKGAKLRIILDCCHSGSCIDLPFTYTSQNRFVKENNREDEQRDCIMISGCKDDQTSADAYLDNTSIGALTWALTTCIDKITRSKGEHVSQFSWKELITILRYTLRNKRFSQIPQISVTYEKLLLSDVDF